MQSDIHSTVARLLPETQKVLCDLIRFPSTSGHELAAMRYLSGLFRKPGSGLKVARVALADKLRADPDYSDPVPDLKYKGRFNLRVARPGRGGGRSLLFNTHVDVVPPSENMDRPWTPRVVDGVVYGRGACDAKGQVATFWLVMRALAEMKLKLAGNVIGHLVVEEENGGNGSLAMARHGERADGCVVLEPSGGKLFTAIRGAVWFRLVFTGRAGHSGQAGVTRSALLMARDAMRALEDYHAQLLAGSRGLPLFDLYPNPMPLTFGKLEAGNWPASAPSRAVLEGVLGLLPNKTKEQVCAEFRAVLQAAGDEFFTQNFDLHFMYRHDSSVLDPAHPLPRSILRAAGQTLEVAGMPASCDAWFYNNQLKIPTVVCGPGTLAVAHSKDEQIGMHEIAGAAEYLLAFIADFCGSSNGSVMTKNLVGRPRRGRRGALGESTLP